jgi:2-polyprenyl-6-methoxyphenol hydroxylase-like FAD-dependent oxidoreductase
LPHWSANRVALVGDAAACPSLLAGEGTGLGMLEAYVLAGELHRADGDCARALAAYESRLQTFVSGKQKGALFFRGFFAPQTALGLMVRNLGSMCSRSRCSESGSGRARCTTISRCLITRWVERAMDRHQKIDFSPPGP